MCAKILCTMIIKAASSWNGMVEHPAQNEQSISTCDFFIKDMIDQGQVLIEHCMTKGMWSDVLTKPKQG